MQQTAVKWLEKEFVKLESTIGVYSVMYELIEQAKEMEKQQIIDAHLTGLIHPLEIEATKQAEHYYNETYGSDAKDVVLGYKTSLDVQMLDRIEPKQETLEEAAKEFVLSHDFSKLTNPNHLANRCFQFGAKWQQEKMYSDMQEYAEFCIRCYEKGLPGLPCIIAKDWFEQFKKNKI
jgi:hypothetical protein